MNSYSAALEILDEGGEPIEIANVCNDLAVTLFEVSFLFAPLS